MTSKQNSQVEEARERLLRLAAEQGVKPLTLEILRAMGEVWPADESVDDFLEARMRWREEASRRIRLDE